MQRLLIPTKVCLNQKEILPVISVTRRIFVFERTGDRTLDPQIKSLLLYQLSYPPDAR